MKRIIVSALLVAVLLAGCTPQEAEDPDQVGGEGAAAEPAIPLNASEEAHEVR